MPTLSPLAFPLNEPFYYGGGLVSGLSPLVPGNFHVAIDGHEYLMDVRRYRQRTLPIITDQVDQSSEPGEQSLSREGFWPRSQSRFDLGAGQEFFDEDGSSRRRWWTSKGIDAFTDDRSLCLLPDTEAKATVTSAATDLLSVGGYLYIADGTNLRFTADPSTPTPTYTTIAAGGTIVDIATDGVYVYVAITGSAIQRALVGASSFASWGTATAQPDILAFTNGRLLGADANILIEIPDSGIATTIRNDPRGTSAVWASIVGTPATAFAALNAGGRGYIYALTVDDVSTAIDPPILAGELPIGESVYTLAYYGGTLLIGTSAGLRAAVVDGTRIDIGESIDIDGGVRCFAPEARFVWFGWSDYDDESTGAGRVDLASNTSESTFVPAYASDVMAEAQGTVRGIARHGGNTYFTVAGSGLFGSTATLVEFGTFNTGDIRFGTLAPKVFSGALLGHDPLAGSIQAAIILEDDTTLILGTSDSASSTTSDLFDVEGAEGVAAQLELTFTRATPTTGPCLRWWTLNALPVPRRVREIIVPLKIHATVTDLRNVDHKIDVRAEYEHLLSLATSARFVNYQEGDAIETVRVDNVVIGDEAGDITSFVDPTKAPAYIWFQGGTVLVRLLTREE